MYFDQVPVSSTITFSSSSSSSSSPSTPPTIATINAPSSSSSISSSSKCIPIYLFWSSTSVIVNFPIGAACSLSNDSPTYTTERIKSLLKKHSSIYTVIENEKTNTSLCWKVFGFPAKKTDNSDHFERIKGFSSCRLCYQTFAYTAKTGTRNMLVHSCVKNLSLNKITTFTTLSPSCDRTNPSGLKKNYKQIRIHEKEIEYVKDIACSWICHDMRSFKVIEDVGLKNLLQEFVILGKLFFIVYSFCLTILPICSFIFRFEIWRIRCE